MNRAIILILAIATFSSCDDDKNCINGSGQTNDYTIQVASFTKLDLSGPFDIIYEQGPNQEVVITAEPEVWGILEYKVSDNYLQLDFGNRCFNSNVGVTVHIISPDIEKINCSGVCDIESDGSISLDRLAIVVSGTSEIDLNGTVDFVEIDCSGTVNADNFDLITGTTNIEISGSGDLEVNCTDALDIRVSGSATIKYLGSPAITENVSGTLNLINAN